MQNILQKFQVFSKYIMANFLFLLINLIPITVLNIYGLEFLLDLKLGLIIHSFITTASMIALLNITREMAEEDSSYSFIKNLRLIQKNLLPHGLIGILYVAFIMAFNFNANLFRDNGIRLLYILFNILSLLTIMAFFNYIMMASRYEIHWKDNVINSVKMLLMYFPLSFSHIFSLVIYVFSLEIIPIFSNLFIYVFLAYLNYRISKGFFTSLESGF